MDAFSFGMASYDRLPGGHTDTLYRSLYAMLQRDLGKRREEKNHSERVRDRREGEEWEQGLYKALVAPSSRRRRRDSYSSSKRK